MTDKSFQDVVKNIPHNKVYKKHKQFKDTLKLTIDRKTAGLLLFCGGAAGVGKTYTVITTCKKNNVGFESIRPANPHAFVENLAEISVLPCKPVVLLDDVGSLLTSPNIAEIIKMGWGRDRTIRWRYKDLNYNFKIDNVLVWLSNANIGEDAPNEMKANLEALKSRGGNQMWIDGSDQEKFNYIIWLATEGEMLKKLFVSREASEKAINFFIEHRNKLQEISSRKLSFIAKEAHLGLKEPELKRLHLTERPIRDICGFGQLKLVKPNVWKEE